jgi:Xaa-Pro dipeptidase
LGAYSMATFLWPLSMVRAQRVTIESSAQLVQLTKSLWGPGGRIAHYVAAHHLGKLRDDALDFVTRKIKAGEKVTEWDVQQRLVAGMRMRGVLGPPPVVAVNDHAADPGYAVTSDKAREIRKGDLLLLDLSGSQEDARRPIFADLTWMAYVGDSVPERYVQAFEQVVAARDAALALVTDRVARRRPVKGFEADQAARSLLSKAGFGDKFLHRTGHSLDTSLHGDGANLDDFETKDTRLLVQGAGFTIAPGIYVKDDFGMRAEINVYVGRGALEVTYPAQKSITALLAPPPAP